MGQLQRQCCLLTYMNCTQLDHHSASSKYRAMVAVFAVVVAQDYLYLLNYHNYHHAILNIQKYI